MKKFLLILMIITSSTEIFAQALGQEVLSYSNGCADPTSDNSGVIIKTKYPYSSARYMPTIIIEGQNFGTNETIGLIISWYIYSNGVGQDEYFYSKTISSYGAYAPEAYLYNDGGFVSIFLKKGIPRQYCISFKVRSWLRTPTDSGADASWYTGWSGLTTNSSPNAINENSKLTYKNSIGDATIVGSRPIRLNSELGNINIKGSTGNWVMNHGFLGSNGTDLGGLWGYGTADAIDQWSIGKASVDKFFVVKSSGNVGIGTNTPIQKLDVAGSINVGNSTGDNNIQIGSGNGATGSRYSYLDLVGDDTYTDYGLRLLRTNTGVNANSYLIHRGTGDLQIYTQESAPITLGTGNTEKFRVSANGNVGIGTTNPTAKLEISSITGSGLKLSGLSQINAQQGATRALGINDAGEVIVASSTSSNTVEFSVKGDGNKYYPVVFTESEDVWANNISEIAISHANVHRDSTWWGSALAKFRFHSNRWGHGSNFLEPQVYQYKPNQGIIALVAGWKDTPYSIDLIVWLRGKTTYSFKGNTLMPKIYDGVQNPLPYKEINGLNPDNSYIYINHNPKTTVDAYVIDNAEPIWKRDGINVFNSSIGNVGIGTNIPASKLDVFGGVLGNEQGRKLEVARFTSTYGNASFLRIFNTRLAQGVDWTSASTRIQQTIDATDMGYVEFNPNNGQLGLAFGTSSGESMRLANGGNVGIGTTNPVAKFEVAGGTVKFSENWFPFTDGNNYHRALNHIFADNAGTEKIRITGTGNIGIGTSNPTSKLHILDNVNPILTIGKTDNTGGEIQLGNGNHGIKRGYKNGNDVGFYTTAGDLYLSTTNVTPQFVLKDNGSVGIGVTTNLPAGYKLAIAGDMIAERVVVKLQSNWPDYVFKTGYSLRPLSEVESFLKVNNHLPDVPSEAEVKVKGIDVEQMNAMLLKKVEELTLYMIELQKQNDVLKKRMDSLYKK